MNLLRNKDNNENNEIKVKKEFIKPTEYVYLKLIPTSSTKNEKTGDIAKKVNTLYKKFNKRYNKKKIELESLSKLGFLISIEKKEIAFYLITPQNYKTEMLSTLENVWKGVNTEEVAFNEIPIITNEYTMSTIETESEDALSLRIDKRDNFLLSSTLSVVNILDDTERVFVYYNFLPKSNVSVRNARANMKETNDKIKQNYSVKKGKDVKSMLRNAGIQTTLFINDVVVDVLKDFGVKDVKSNSKEITKDYFQLQLSEESKKKITKDLVFVQGMVFSKSSRGVSRQEELNSFVCDNYNKIALDNDIKYKHIKEPLAVRVFKKGKEIKILDVLKYQIPNVPINVFSVDECQHLISLPGKSIIEEYPMISSIAYRQHIIEECIKKGYISLGEHTNRGESIPVYLSAENPEIKTNGVYLIGPQGCGKSTYIKRYICDVVANGEVAVVLDYIGTNELARDIEKIMPKDKITIINLGGDIDENTQGLAFNELDISNIDKSKFKTEKQYRKRVLMNLYDYAEQMSALLNGVNGDGPGGQLTSKMEGILRTCCLITFSQPNKTINDLVKVITNHVVRHQYIEQMPEFIREDIQDEIDETLMKIDVIEYIKDPKSRTIAKDENGNLMYNVVGTQEGSILNFLDRFNALRKTYVMKSLLKVDPSNNLDFVDFMMKGGQCVIVKMPERDYGEEAASVVSSFYANKILLAIKERKARYEDDHPEDPKAVNLPLVHFVLDEVHKVPTAYTLISKWFTQFRKYRMKPVLAGHYLGQLTESGVGKQGINRLLGTKFNYVIFRGLDEMYFNELKTKFKGFDYDDVDSLPEHHALVSGYYVDGTKVFVTHLPNDVAKVGHPLFNKGEQNGK